MGCKGSALFSRQEEENIYFHEQDLGFSFNYCEHIDFVIRKYSQGDYLKINSWTLVVKHLHLNFPRPDKTHLVDFYKSYTEGGCIRTKDLLVTGVLLGDGTDADKARLLFEIADSDSRKVIDKLQVIGLLRALLMVSLCYLPLLAGELSNYTRSLQGVEARALGRLLDAIIGSGDEIGKKAFINAFIDSEATIVLRPSGARRYCYTLTTVKNKN